MPSWKKVIISGSDATLNTISASLGIQTSGDILPTTDNTLSLGSVTNRFQLNGGTPVTVDGSGTANVVTRFQGNTTVEDSKIFSSDTQTRLEHSNSGNSIFIVSGSNGQLLDVTDEIGDEIFRVNNGSGVELFTVSGSGNVKVVNDLTVDTNTLHVDSTNNRVGIGTASPTAQLHIKSTGEATLTLDSAAANAGTLYFKENGTSVHYISADGSVANNPLRFYDYTLGGIAMTINAGNVGIGTTSPAQKLDVNGNASISGSLTVSQGGNITMDGGGTLDTGGGSLDTSGGSIDTNGGNITLGTGALNGTIPGSAVNVDTVTATVKNFVIDHPTPEKEGYKLRHSSLEGPEIGIYYRGKSTSNIIDLPDYWVDLVEEESITVSLTSFGSPCQHYIEDIRDNQVIIGCACGTPNYHFTVYGERKDVEKLVVEYKEEKYL